MEDFSTQMFTVDKFSGFNPKKFFIGFFASVGALFAGITLLNVIILAVLILAVYYAYKKWWKKERFSVLDEWPFMPPRYWGDRKMTQWEPWFFYQNQNQYHPAIPEVTTYDIDEYQFPVKTIDTASHERDVPLPVMTDTKGKSEEMVNEHPKESQPAAAQSQTTTQESKDMINVTPQSIKEHLAEEAAVVTIAQPAEWALNMRTILLAILVIALGYYGYKNYIEDEF